MKLNRATWIDPTEAIIDGRQIAVIINGRQIHYFCTRHGEGYAKGADGLDLFGIPIGTGTNGSVVCSISVHPFYMLEAADVE